MNKQWSCCIDKNCYLKGDSNSIFLQNHDGWTYLPDDIIKDRNGQKITAAQFVCNRVFEIVNQADAFCKQRPYGPQVEEAQPDPKVAEYEKILTDPAAVWTNMLCGKIARPRALDHYEECKEELELKTDQVIDLKWALERLLEACNPDQVESATKDAKQVLKECE